MPRDDSPIAVSPARVAGAVAALAAAALTLAVARADARDRQALATRIAALGARPETLEQVEALLARESDPGERRLAAARALMARDFAATRPESVNAFVARLGAARELAAEALGLLPASWEAAMVVGAATFERRVAERDTRLFTAARDWEAPLLAAARRAHDTPAAEQALARAYLEVWPALSERRRPPTEELLRRAFRDPRFRERSFERWLAIAGSPGAAERLLPADARSLALLAAATWRRGEPADAAAYRRRERDALRAELEGRLDAALSAPDRVPRGLDEEISAILVAAPPGGDFAPLVDRAARTRPPGPARPELGDAARTWLEWALPLCLVGDCPLPPLAIERLASAAGARLDAPDAALAALAAGDRPRAELLARRSEALWSEAWAPYLILAARGRLAANDVAGARDLLAQVHSAQQSRPAWVALAASCGLPQPAGDDPARSGPPWQPTAWRADGGVPALELEAPRALRSLVVGFHRPASGNALLLPEWDGEVFAPLVVGSGAEALRIDVDARPGVHLLRLRPLEGRLPEIGVTTPE